MGETKCIYVLRTEYYICFPLHQRNVFSFETISVAILAQCQLSIILARIACEG